MAALNSSSLVLNSSSISSSSSSRRRVVKATLNIPKPLSLPSLRLAGSGSPYSTGSKRTTEKQLSPIRITESGSRSPDPLVMAKLYAILEAVADRVEMHKNIGEQRSNWNSLLLTSINAITLAAATMTGVAAIGGSAAPAAALALKLSSASLYVAATGMLSIMNKIQPSQLAEEQRNATRLFQQLKSQIETLISIGSPRSADVREMTEKVLAVDKAYPLPLLGVMLEKFPAKVEPAVWWTETRRKSPKGSGSYNGWNGKLEEEMKEIANVMRIKDTEDYLKLAEKALKLNKFLAVSGPALTGLAAVGAALVGSSCDNGWAVMLGVVGGALASVVNTFEHGGQVGMVFEMYRSNAGFFKLMEESIGANLRESEPQRRENGEVFEVKVGLQLGRTLTELRDLAESASVKGESIDEFASKLF